MRLWLSSSWVVPRSTRDAEARHRPLIAAAIENQQAVYRALMLDWMERIWNIREDATVTREAVIEYEHGFDPNAPEPEFDRYPYV